MKVQEKHLIAVASTDGKIINQHFGHAEKFLIYQADAEKIELLEERFVNRYCLGIDTHVHPFEEDRFMEVVNVIKDCRFVLVSQVGPTPEKRLKGLGVIPVIMDDYIEDGIRKVLTMGSVSLKCF